MGIPPTSVSGEYWQMNLVRFGSVHTYLIPPVTEASNTSILLEPDVWTILVAVSIKGPPILEENVNKSDGEFVVNCNVSPVPVVTLSA